MISKLSLWALSCLLAQTLAQEVQDAINKDNYREGVEPYCNEVCPSGYEYIEELGHCYRMLLDLGPTSQDRGVEACGFASGYLPGLDRQGDEDIIRTYFWDKYADQMKSHPNNLDNSGFWTAYLRPSSDGLEHKYGFRLEYTNLYTGEPMPKEFWRVGQPSNENYDQACVARKWFWIQWFREDSTGKKNGLDDYVCAFPHWVICQVRKEFALNKRGSNLELIKQVKDDIIPNSGVEREQCEQPWVEQTADQFEILIANAEQRGNKRALKAYEKAKNEIQAPNYSVLAGALN